MKKVLLGVSGLLLVLIVLAFVFRTPLMMMYMGSQIAPEEDFSADRAPAGPDYTSDANWASLPAIYDPADQMPEGVTREPMGVAVFFVHPTSYMSKAGWNQPLDDRTANWMVDERILRHQASVFNGCCDIYAPRYRQATFYAFMDQSGNGKQALDLAYSDVSAAFDNFLTRIGPDEPFILAGHSQGTDHATRLLRDKVADTALMDRLVAAYLVGFSITRDQLGSVPVCETAEQTGCALGWNTMDGVEGGLFGNEELVCVNPLSWTADGTYAGHELNLGAIGYPRYGPPGPDEDVSKMTLEPGAADAMCIDGQLAVKELRSESFPSRMFGSSMHVYDYSLFHMNMRQNAIERISGFLAKSARSPLGE